MDTIVGVQVHAAEANRLKQDKQRKAGRVDWKRWGPYLSERQWATVREDYSSDGSWYAKCNAGLVYWSFSVESTRAKNHCTKCMFRLIV